MQNTENKFSIDRIFAKNHDSGFGGYKWKVIVIARVEADYWKRHQKKNLLGQIYGVDISNFLYRINNNFVSHCPMVDDSARCSNGFKTVTLTYFFNDPKRAESLGLEVMYFGPNKEPHSKYSDYVDLTKQLNRKKIKAV